MHYYPLKSFNTTIKIAGDTITYKKYSKSQAYNYKVKSNVNVKHEENIIEIECQGQILNVSTETGEIIDKEQEKKERFIKSCFRAKNAIYDLVACNVNKFVDYEDKKQRVKFLTLTFKENITDVAQANKEIPIFLKRVCYYLWGIKTNVIKYIAVPELQERGAWHFHIIIFNMPYVKHEHLLKLWGLGGVYINALKTDDVNAVAQYVVKYIGKGIEVKEGQEETEINNSEEKKGDKRLSNYDNYKALGMENKKRYYCSRGLHRPDIIRLELPESVQEEIEEYLSKNLKEYMKDGQAKKYIYKAEYENEYRGKIELTKCRVKDVKMVKDIANYMKFFNEQFKVEYKIDWNRLNQKRVKYARKNMNEIMEQELERQYILWGCA